MLLGMIYYRIRFLVGTPCLSLQHFLFKGKILSPSITPLFASAIFSPGLIFVIATYAAIRQEQICASGIAEIASGNDAFGKTMILAVFPELYSILAFAATFLISSSL